MFATQMLFRHIHEYYSAQNISTIKYLPLAAWYNWYQGPVPGRSPAVQKHCFIPLQLICVTNNKLNWQNPTPSSPRYCRCMEYDMLKNPVTSRMMKYFQVFTWMIGNFQTSKSLNIRETEYRCLCTYYVINTYVSLMYKLKRNWKVT
jgi:hypothetical protein